MPTETINIIVTDRGGARTVSRSITGIGTAADSANRKTGKLVGTLRDVATVSRDIRNLFLILGAAKAIGFTRAASDEFKRMNNTLRGFEVGEKNLDNIRRQIKGVANEARVGAKEATVLFGRLKQATKDLGLSNRQVLELTGTAQKALRLGGASATEATQAVRQLTQAFNKGKLDGDEFRSVLENAPVLAELLSEKLGVTKDQLRKMAEEGQISTNVLVGALQQGRVKIDQLFSTLEKTTDDVFTKLRNNAVEAFGEFDRASGISDSFIAVIDRLAEGFSTNLLNGVTLVGTGLALVITKLKTLKIAMSFTGLGAGFTILFQLNKQIKEMSGGTRDLASVFEDIGWGIRQALKYLRDFTSEMFLLMNLNPGKGSMMEQFLNFTARLIAMSENKDEIEKQAFEAMINSRTVQDLVKSGPAAGGFKEKPTVSELRDRMKTVERPEKQGFLSKLAGSTGINLEADDHFVSDIEKKVNQQLRQLYSKELFLAQERFAEGMDGSLKEMGSDSYVGLGQKQRAEDMFQENRRARAADELESKLLSIQGILDKAKESQGALAEEAANVQGKIVRSVQEALSGDTANEISTEQLQQYSAKAEELLKQIEDTTGSAGINNALQENLKAQIAALDDLKTKINESKSLKDEDKQAAISTIDQVAQQANAIMVAETARTAGIMEQLYVQVLNRLKGLAASLPGAGALATEASAGTTGFGGLTEADIVNLGTPIKDLNTGLEQSNQSLETVLGNVQNLGNQAVGSFKSASDAARGFGNTTNNVGNQINNNFGQVFSSLENALVGFVQTGKLDFQSLINSMLADLARLLIRMLIIQPLMGFFGGLFGFGGGGLVGGFSSGGFVGGFSGGGPISSGGFNIPSFGGGCPGGVCDLPSFATGSGVIPGFGGSRSDRFLAAVSPGEFVVNAQDTRRNLPDLMRMNNGGAVVEGHSGGTSVMTTQITVNVQSTGQDAGADGAKIARAIEAQMDKKLNEYTRRQMKSGGAFKQREA